MKFDEDKESVIIQECLWSEYDIDEKECLQQLVHWQDWHLQIATVNGVVQVADRPKRKNHDNEQTEEQVDKKREKKMSDV